MREGRINLRWCILALDECLFKLDAIDAIISHQLTGHQNLVQTIHFTELLIALFECIHHYDVWVELSDDTLAVQEVLDGRYLVREVLATCAELNLSAVYFSVRKEFHSFEDLGQIAAFLD